MSSIYNKFYGFISLGFIELLDIARITTLMGDFFNFIIVALQLVVAILTIFKLAQDIKNKRFKSIEQTEKSVKKKRKFLFVLVEYFKSIKLWI